MKCTVRKIETYELVLEMDTLEAMTLKGMVQNQLHPTEEETESEIREAIFMALDAKGVK